MIGNQLETVTSTDPQNNVLMRMVDWVENGNAPETITGMKYVNVSCSPDLRREGIWTANEE